MKVALVCDWLTNVGGAEKVLLELHRMYPKAPIYTSQYNPRRIDWFDDADVRVGWMRIFPASWRRFLGFFRQKYFAKLDLSDYDLVISVTGAEAKGVKTKKGLQKRKRYGDHPNDSTFDEKSQEGGAVHISYCHVPTQYYWQMYGEYVREPGFGILNPLVRFCFKALVKPLRKRDYEAAQRVDQFVTISEYAKGLITKYYKRDSIVVHPPVEAEAFSNCLGRLEYTSQKSKSGIALKPQKDTSDYIPYYITTSRQVTWKRLDLAVKACVRLGRPLLVVGEGPEHKKLMKLAEGKTDAEGKELVKFLPVMGKEELAECLAGARGYLFPSLEPFGIAPVEALATGCPVIAFGEGGARDYIKDGENGVLFDKQTVKSLAEAILKFEKMDFDYKKVVKSAEKFGVKRFDKEMENVICAKVK